MDSTVCSCAKCNCQAEPEIIAKGEVILAICPNVRLLDTNHGYKINLSDPTIHWQNFEPNFLLFCF